MLQTWLDDRGLHGQHLYQLVRGVNLPLDCRRPGQSHGRRRPWRMPAPVHDSSPESWRLLQHERTSPHNTAAALTVQFSHFKTYTVTVRVSTEPGKTRVTWARRERYGGPAPEARSAPPPVEAPPWGVACCGESNRAISN